MDSGIAFGASVPPIPDLEDPATVQLGAKKRLGTPLQAPDPKMLDRSKVIVTRIIKEQVERIHDLDILSVEGWLAHSSYTEAEKQVIRDAPDIDPDAMSDPENRKLINDFASFIKEEFYPSFKAPRTIQGLSASMKKFLGPVIHALEQVLFKLPHFAKFIPVNERARWMNKKFMPMGSCPKAASDFTSYEQSWIRPVMEVFEMPLIEHMLESCSIFQKFMVVFRSMETSPATLVFKWLCVTVGAVRKSGTTNTSFSNGGGTWLIHEALGEILGLGQLVGCFEGDDGLFCYSSGRFPTPADYAKLGFDVKLEIHEESSRASFCGIVYDPIDCVNIVDPIKTLNRIGWISRYYVRAKGTKLKALLRSKAMSLCVQCVDCPILADCAQWLLRVTRSIDARWVATARCTTWWDREILRMSRGFNFNITPNVPHNTRLLMEDVFGVSVRVQLEYEAWFKNCDELRPMPYLFDQIDDSHQAMADHFTRWSAIPALDSYPVFADLSAEMEEWIVKR